MKKFNSICMILLSAFWIVSCESGLDTISADSIVYLAQSGSSEQTVLLGDSEFELGIIKSGINQNNATVLVTLGIDEPAGSEFMVKNAGYELLPSNYYTLPEQSVSIGTHEERGFYRIKLKGIDETFTNKKYFLPISIKNSDNGVKILDAKKVAILQFPRFRNVFEAKYKAYGQAVLSGTPDTDKLRVDEVITSSSVNTGTIQVKGIVSGLNLLLTVNNGQVQITGATGSESFAVSNTAGKTSTYAGEFSKVYQCNTGTFMLYYTYTSAGKQMDASVELKFWL